MFGIEIYKSVTASAYFNKLCWTLFLTWSRGPTYYPINWEIPRG